MRRLEELERVVERSRGGEGKVGGLEKEGGTGERGGISRFLVKKAGNCTSEVETTTSDTTYPFTTSETSNDPITSETNPDPTGSATSSDPTSSETCPALSTSETSTLPTNRETRPVSTTGDASDQSCEFAMEGPNSIKEAGPPCEELVVCGECGEPVSPWTLPEHLDLHLAQSIHRRERSGGGVPLGGRGREESPGAGKERGRNHGRGRGRGRSSVGEGGMRAFLVRRS